MVLRIEVLGPLRVVSSGGAIGIARPAQRRLLSLLALAGGRRVSTEALIDRFWSGEPPDTARAAIQTHISGLRKSLGDGVLVTEGYGYRLQLEAHDFDVAEFDESAFKAAELMRAREWEPALDAARRALMLWRNEPYPDLVEDDFARPEIGRITETRLELLEARAECLVALGRESEALPDLEALVIEHPYRERLWEHLMTARYRLGRPTEALQAFRQISEHLAEIGVEPGDSLRRLEESILLHDKFLSRTRNNLPTELDAFIGREEELRGIASLVADSRLVTLTGPGGTGKTRLALQTARRALARFPDGVWFVELADLDEPALIPASIATAMGLSGDGDLTPLLKKALTPKHALLVVDNCEHVAEEAGHVIADLLGAAPYLTVLTTTRQPLRTAGEQLFNVPGLVLHESGTPEEVAHSDGVRLFDRRARQADPDFDVASELGAVVTICRRLDSMPLGIELAAARVSSLGVAEIERHLDNSLDFLTSGESTGHPRHQTLEAAIEWSYRLASDGVKKALAVLSVFRGGFDLDMAVWMLGVDAPRLVADLVDQSLVTTYRGELGRRYRILETIRQFGLARAFANGWAEEAFRTHTEWCVSFTDRIWDSWQKPGFDQVEMVIHEEFENLTAAFERAENSGDRSIAGRIAEGLLWHWQISGYLSKALALFDRALKTCENDERRVGLLAKRAEARFNSNDVEGAQIDAEKAYRLAGSLPASVAKAYAVNGYAQMFAVRPDLEAADGVPFAKEAVDVALLTGNDPLTAVLELGLAKAFGWAGNSSEARPTLERAISLIEETGDPVYVAYCYTHATTVAMQLGDFRREGLADFSSRLERWLELHPHIAHRFRLGWTEWAKIQAGDLQDIEAKLDEWRHEDHLEGFIRLGNLVPLGVALWMQGSLERAVQVIEECEQTGINPRWYHDFYPLKVDVLVDLGRVREAERAAEVYLGYEAVASESPMKLGVLNPLVRGVANLSDSSPSPHELQHRAIALVDRMEQILAEHPPLMGGSVSMETPSTHLAFAKAELTRITQPDPEAWSTAMEAADFLYFRLYARIRLGEAQLGQGQVSDGRTTLESAFDESQRIGATRLVALAEDSLSA